MSGLKTEELLRAIMKALESKEELFLQIEEQNIDYEGAIFRLNQRVYRTRLAKLYYAR